MTKFPAMIAALLVCAAIFPFSARAQEVEPIEVDALSEVMHTALAGKVDFDSANDT